MLGYYRELAVSDSELARRSGVGRSQVHMARERNVGPDNAEKISSCVARELGLTEEERLRLKAEIMGHPDNLAHAYLGTGQKAARTLGIIEHDGQAITSGTRQIPHTSGVKALAELERMEAPQAVVESVRGRVKPEPEPARRVTYRPPPDEHLNRQRIREELRERKPALFAALARLGKAHGQVASEAGLGRETLRGALYDYAGERSAGVLSEYLADQLALSGEERATVHREIRTPFK